MQVGCIAYIQLFNAPYSRSRPLPWTHTSSSTYSAIMYVSTAIHNVLFTPLHTSVHSSAAHPSARSRNAFCRVAAMVATSGGGSYMREGSRR